MINAIIRLVHGYFIKKTSNKISSQLIASVRATCCA